MAETIDSLLAVLNSASDLERSLHVEPRPDAGLKDVEQLVQLAISVLKAPRMDRCQIGHGVWESRRELLSEIVKQGHTFSAMRIELGEKVAEVAWQTDLADARRYIAGYGRSFLRMFNRNYREAVATLKGVLKERAPRTLNSSPQSRWHPHTSRQPLHDGTLSADAASKDLHAGFDRELERAQSWSTRSARESAVSRRAVAES